MNYKKKYTELENDYFNLKREVDRLKLKMRSKETIVKNIIKKLKVEAPYDNFVNNLRRMNFDELVILEDKIK